MSETRRVGAFEITISSPALPTSAESDIADIPGRPDPAATWGFPTSPPAGGPRLYKPLPARLGWLTHLTIAKVPRMTDDAWSGGTISESDPRFVEIVREAASVTYSTASGQPTHEVYVVLASELRQRGIYPDPSAVLEAAMLISRGKKPAVLRG